MCDCGECRQCRLEDLRLDKAMGVQRTYIKGQLPSLTANIEGRKVVGNGLVAVEGKMSNRLRPPPAPRGTGLPRAERVRLQTEERKADRDEVDISINGVVQTRLVSRMCPCHGTYSGYQNWFCQCAHCTAAWSKHRAMKRADDRSN